MAESVSVDPRSRAVAAVEGGPSRRRAAERFGVSPSSALRWHARYRGTGEVAPRRQGGDRRPGRAEAEAAFVLDRVAAVPGVTLAELRAELRAERGVWPGIGTLWRFFRRRRITLKERRRMRASSSAPT